VCICIAQQERLVLITWENLTVDVCRLTQRPLAYDVYVQERKEYFWISVIFWQKKKRIVGSVPFSCPI